MAQFETKIGATGSTLSGLQDNLKNIAKTGVGSFDEVAASTVDVRQNMKGITGKEIENVTENAMQMATGMNCR